MRSPADVKIGPFTLSDYGRALVVAEIGVNHNGDVELAKQMIRSAKTAGADCVKFQTFQADRLATTAAPKAAYQLLHTDPGQSQLQMLKTLELSRDDFSQIILTCRQEQVLFLSTPYDFDDVDLLESLDVPAYKIASGQAAEPVFLEHVARKGKPVILSTGMCTLEEVHRAVDAVRNAGNSRLIVLHCTTNYPCDIRDVNLRAMATMRDSLGVLVGYSDHTQGLAASPAAVAMGACLIERHFTTDKTLPGPDQSTSSDPEEFAAMVRLIRETQQALGSPVKAPTAAEQANIPAVRRGVFAATRITAGTLFTPENLAVKRPLAHLSGADLPNVLGRLAAVDIEPGAALRWEMVR